MRLLNMVALLGALVLAVVVAPASLAAVKDLGDPVQVVYFAADSDEVPADAAKALAGVKAAFKASGKKYLVIRGHADPKEYTEPGATEAYGVGLSQRRSSQVRSLLWDEASTEEARAFNGSIIIEANGEAMPKKAGGSRRRAEIFFTNVEIF